MVLSVHRSLNFNEEKYMAGFADIFYDTSMPTDKKLLRAGVEDYKLISTVFPETGVPTHLTVYMFHKVAEELRSRGILSYEDREKKQFTIEQLKKII